jgi:Rrf2 family protein
MRLELTRRADYAVRAMLALSASPADGHLSVREIAASMGIPHRFLPQVMQDLVRAGLVHARTGRTGGYRLARTAAAIPLLEVIEAVEGDGRRLTCVLRGGPCGRDRQCAVHDVFFAAQTAMLDRLAATTFSDLAGRLGGPAK